VTRIFREGTRHPATRWRLRFRDFPRTPVRPSLIAKAEVTGERIRDKIAASKQKGMWMGGLVPLGYDVIDRRLVVNQSGAETVREIFGRYLELGSVRLLMEDLNRRGIRSKVRVAENGKRSGGNPFFRGALYGTLSKSHIHRRDSSQGCPPPGAA
jgi:site-specific DNA recombinase